MFEASCPGCGVAASPYEASCPTCGSSLRVPCRECPALVHVADSACYGCGAVWPADPRPAPGLTGTPTLGELPGAAPDTARTGFEPATTPAPAPIPAPAASDEDGRPRRSRRASLLALAAAAVVVASGAVFVASSRGTSVPTGGVSSAAASPSDSTAPAATTVPGPADVERDRLIAELRFTLALPEPTARCLADSVRAALGDTAFVAAHLAVTGDAPDAGHAVLDPALAAARPGCGLPAAGA